MSTLRKLRRKAYSTEHQIEPFEDCSLLFDDRMSEVLLDFAEPMLGNIPDSSYFDDAIAFSAVCWNLALMPSQEQRKHLNETVDAMAGSDLFKRDGIEQDIQMLLDRKKALFADNKRVIVDYEIVHEKTGPHLIVISAPFDDDYVINP